MTKHLRSAKKPFCRDSAFRTCDSEDEEIDTAYKDESSLVASVGKSHLSASAPATVTCSNLLGSFEECVLNGRLEPVSTVQGFAAEIAASGAFCLKHTTKPVTVFFYTLCDNDQISSPYMVSKTLSLSLSSQSGVPSLVKSPFTTPARGSSVSERRVK